MKNRKNFASPFSPYALSSHHSATPVPSPSVPELDLSFLKDYQQNLENEKAIYESISRLGKFGNDNYQVNKPYEFVSGHYKYSVPNNLSSLDSYDLSKHFLVTIYTSSNGLTATISNDNRNSSSIRNGILGIRGGLDEKDASGEQKPNKNTSAYKNFLKIKSAFEAIQKIKLKQFTYKRDTKYGQKTRAYSNLTNLNKSIRKFLLLDGKPIIEIDIVNAQPLLLLIMMCQIQEEMKDLLNKEILIKEIEKFREMVESGKFYETIAEATNKTRDQAKTAFYGYLFSRNSESGTKVRNWFKNKFYMIYQQLCRIKEENDYRRVAINLQTLESNMIIDYSVDQLRGKKYPMVTIHDSIVTNSKTFALKLSQHLKKEFKKFKINVKVKLNEYGEEKELFVVKQSLDAQEKHDKEQFTELYQYLISPNGDIPVKDSSQLINHRQIVVATI
jgi:hypothetical protein